MVLAGRSTSASRPNSVSHMRCFDLELLPFRTRQLPRPAGPRCGGATPSPRAPLNGSGPGRVLQAVAGWPLLSYRVEETYLMSYECWQPEPSLYQSARRLSLDRFPAHARRLSVPLLGWRRSRTCSTTPSPA